ncbi:hypothetical protein FMM68_00245 [Lachnospiraceae bacterium MD329]|nr:hypothetical protein [Lachnospiraceae bacterium MD329]
MSESKTKPKTREKPTTASHTVKNAPKTVKSIPYNVLRNAPSVMKEQLAKQTSEKLSKVKQDGQSEQSPENYATDTVENAVYGTAAKIYRTTRTIAEHTIKSHRAHKIKTKENYTMPDIPVNPTVTDNTPKLANNQPKTFQLSDGKISPNSVGSQSNTEISRNLRRISPKTKGAYTAARSDTLSAVPEAKKKAVQQIKAKAQQKSDIKKKENYIKQHSADTDIKTPDTARRDYARDKLKAKSEEQKRLQHTDANMSNTLNTDISPDTLPIDKPNIKTKESYMQSLRSEKTAEHIKSAYRTPKQKSSEIARQIQSTSKAVHSKEKMTSKTVKSGRNVFKASRTAKKKASKARKVVVKTQKQVTKQAAKQTAKMAKEAAQRSAQAAKATARVAGKVAVKVAQAVVSAAKAIISAIASGGAVAVVAVVLIIVIIIAAIVASPFGIFVSEEVTNAGTIPLSQIIAEYNVELTQEVEDIELSVDHTEVDVIDNQTDRNIVLAVFAAKTAGAENNTAEDVVIFDDVKAEKLKAYFRAANTVSHTVEEIAVSDTETKKKLTVTISEKTKDELMDLYGLTAKQREAVETLLEHGDVLTSSSHSLAITNADVQSIINGLPSSLPQRRKDVVKNAGSLVGKVNYFWGGKSSAIGWDSAWGTMRRVTAAGSPSSGTLRAYGLDCSGFVMWAFNNSGMGYAVGHGTYGQRDASIQVTASTVQAGDLCFLPSYSHVGIVVGKDTGGNILVIHCSSGANNVVVSTASSVGFTVFRRPNCY